MPAVGLESDEVSLLDIFHFSNDKNFSLTLKQIIEINGEEIIKRIPLSIDNALYKYFTYLRDKSAFWGGVTRDIVFGGSTISWYELLWNGFATNPLFLGTITHSEGINKLNIYVKVINNRNAQENDIEENDFSLLAQIDCSIFLEELMHDKNTKNLSKSKKDYFDDINYSKYAFIRINKEHQLLSKKLEKLPKVFLPNGVIGKHAMFTILENTIRNIKHKINNENNIKEDGINLCLTVEEKIIDDYHLNGSPVLFQVGVWLNYFEDQTRNKNSCLYETFHEKLKQNVINPVSYQPNFGGNSQDKICAAMLLNNTFISINQDLDSNRKIFFPYILPSIIFKEQTGNEVFSQNEYSYYDHILNSESYNKVARNEIRSESCLLKRYFHLWIGEDIKVLSNNEDLDFQNDNISRYKIIVDKSNLKNFKDKLSLVRKQGVIRVINSKLNKISFKKAYFAWLRSWLNLSKIGILHISIGNNPDDPKERAGLIQFSANEINYFNLKELENIDPVKVTSENYLFYQHGKDNANQCKVTSHNSFMKEFYSGGGINKVHKLKITDTIKLLELTETIITTVYIFDNRLNERLPSYNETMWKDQLNLHSYAESYWEEKKREICTYANFVIIHLTFIEDIIRKKYNIRPKENLVRIFAEKELGISFTKFDNNGLILIVTSGRGRIEWEESILHPQISFRPIEALMSAIEDGIKVKDDFQVKYNIIKTLFGS